MPGSPVPRPYLRTRPMTHDRSPLSGVCLACGEITGLWCEPTAAEPDDAEAALARYLAAIGEEPELELHGIAACRAWAAA